MTHTPLDTIEHPVLGLLIPDGALPTTLVGKVNFGGASIELRISPDDRPLEETFQLAVRAVGVLAQLDSKSRELIADNSLDGYNSDWRFGTAVLENGATEDFEKPHLTRSDFCNALQFQCIEAAGNTTLTLYYGDNDMFWGHDLQVTSFDGLAFKDTHASM